MASGVETTEHTPANGVLEGAIMILFVVDCREEVTGRFGFPLKSRPFWDLG